MIFRNILFPVDFSERSEAIVPHVLAARRRFGAALTLVHFVEVPALAYGPPDSAATPGFPSGQLLDYAKADLAEFAATHFPNEAVTVEVREGDPGNCITEFARTSSVDLIMMPTRGRGVLRAALLGSVTAKVLHDATCAVWTDAHSGSNRESNPDWKNIVCGVDLSSEGEKLIHRVWELAAASGAKVCLAHATPPPNAGAEEYLGREFAEELKIEARANIASMQSEAGTDFDVCVEAGTIPDVLRWAAHNHHADLVLIGRGVVNEFAGRLRSHVYAIVRDMPCPVLSV